VASRNSGGGSTENERGTFPLEEEEMPSPGSDPSREVEENVKYSTGPPLAKIKGRGISPPLNAV
jgi:hypothetical protein